MEYVTAVSQIIYVFNDFKHNYKLLNGSIFPDRNPLYKLAYTLHALSLLYKLRSVQNTGTCYPGQGWFVRNLGWGR